MFGLQSDRQLSGETQVDTLDEAIALVNSNEHGNGTALFTRSGVAARKFQSDVQVGMVGINVRRNLSVTLSDTGHLTKTSPKGGWLSLHG